MADDGVRMPMGTGGLLRYYDESKSKIQIKPQYVIILIALTVIVEFVLNHIGK